MVANTCCSSPWPCSPQLHTKVVDCGVGVQFNEPQQKVCRDSHTGNLNIGYAVIRELVEIAHQVNSTTVVENDALISPTWSFSGAGINGIGDSPPRGIAAHSQR